MSEESREPARELVGVDFDRANAARMYDYYLGGAHNFEVDRVQAARVIAANPRIVDAARENRAFLARAVRWCIADGINQFLDLGSGVPTVGNVHEVAQQGDARARVAYIDFEPVAVAHATQLLEGNEDVTVTRADLRDVQQVLQAPGVAGLLDFSQPIALLAVAVLHFVPDDPAPLLGAYYDALAPHSVIVVSHASHDQDDPELAALTTAGQGGYRGSATELVLRDRAELRRALAGLQLIEPGLVDVTQWPLPTDTPPVSVYSAIPR